MLDTPDRAASPADHWHLAAENPLGDEEPIRAEELLALHEQALGDITALFTPAGVFTYVSAASRATLGWEPEELVGRMADTYVHPEDLPAVMTCHKAVLRSS